MTVRSLLRLYLYTAVLPRTGFITSPLCWFVSALYGRTLLRKGYHEAAEQAEEALGPLAGVVGLKAHTHLHDAPAQDDDAQGLDDRENKIRQVVDDGEGVAASGGEGRDRQRGAEGQDQNGGEVEARFVRGWALWER